MAEYTKIGRIRPDYADTWDASRSYTALEMVKSADSYHAYIAKQDVPAGTPLTNAEYWGEVLDVSDVIAESVAATNRANTAAANADAAREGIQDDLNGLHDELRTKADGILSTAEGETITLTDSSDDPMRGLRIFGRTAQDGTPTPENPVPLVSVGDKGSIEVTTTGKNLWDEEWETGYIDLASGTLLDDADLCRSKNYTFVLPTTTYTMSNGSWNEARIAFYTVEKQFISGGSALSFTTPSNCSYIKFYWSGRTYNNDIMINAGGNALPYEPYTGGSLTILTPNGLQGTPLGATIPEYIKAKAALMAGVWWDEKEQQYYISDGVDFERGVYVQQNRIRTFNGSEGGWRMNDGTNPENNNFIYYTSAPDVGIGIGMCDRLPSGMSSDKDFVAVSELYGGVIYVRIKDYMAEDSLSAFKAALAQYPLTVIYPLATPIETPLTAEEIAAYRALHTNKPYTTIYNDEGAHMEVSYNADTKTYIDNKISELAAAIVNTNA